MTTSIRAPRVLIAVLTYQRADDLRELLPELVDQITALPGQTAGASPRGEILVVDNDPAGGARDLVGEFGEGGLVRYAHEATPGIAAARNLALTEASTFDLLVFIDDDERPSAHWLALLLETYRTSHPAAVVGPVVSRYDTEPSEWIRAGRFFDRRRMPTGTRVSLAATNNLLLDVEQVRGLGVRFDERFGLSGGSDSLFTRQLHARGGSMVWCDDAVVIDVVPAERLTRDWVLRRAFRIGNTWSRIHLDGTQSLHRLTVRASLVVRGLARLVGGSARFCVGLLTGQIGQRAKGLRTAARGAGMLTGSVGTVYSEYQRSMPDPAPDASMSHPS
ncbi:glycosyltransferase family 2 protein [Cryobacterium psychrophilum]|uniref:Glycosyltransferase n=1 Tax=Cryobacterium psychrophilum TaxID=41988 RepID=A0A4Y8KKT7_9MICO|nr:glycosyltransferase [Cryobacterium psychrophilum]TDW29958.1 GT2 family glycosyltransferase [Cryobacterium psychrophilum]TFD76520.1 glycosyltransferase [Cryobacterium psychrophilum]